MATATLIASNPLAASGAPNVVDALATLLDEVERSGRWPAALERALITLIPKGEGGEPEKNAAEIFVVRKFWTGENWASRPQIVLFCYQEATHKKHFSILNIRLSAKADVERFCEC